MSSGSSQAWAMNEMPTGSGPTEAAGTVMFAQPETAAAPD